MTFWDSGFVLTLLLLCLLLLGASALRRSIKPLKRLGIPDSIVAGGFGLLLGPGIVGLLPLHQGTLEGIVYHGLAILFIAVSLRAPIKGRSAAEAVSYGFTIPVIAIVQCMIGLLVVLGLTTFADQTHPGLGLLLPLGFQQGPGQALSLGKAWETTGLIDGAQLGLIIASLGFAWAVVIGVPLVAVGKKLGWAKDLGLSNQPSEAIERKDTPELHTEIGGLEPLTSQIAAIAIVYLATYGAVVGLTSLLEDKPQIAAMVWGFHFVIGTLIALAVRKPWRRIGFLPTLHDGQLSRVSGVAIDLMTCAALAAVSIEVLSSNLVPILLLTTLGGVVTLFVIVWLARRAYPNAPLEHAVMLFGTVTGTLPMGLALLRLLDPELKGPAATSAVVGSAIALPLGAALLIVVLPYSVTHYPDGFPGAVWTTLGMLVVYLGGLLVLWRKFGPLRFNRPLLKLWPRE